MSPPLRFGGVPPKATALALLVQDPDADNYVHWAVFHIPPDTSGFDEGQPGWKGPCPPKGDKPHRYVFALYALDSKVDSAGQISGHALGRGTLTGRFSR